MRWAGAVLVLAGCLNFSSIPLAKASIYDSNVVQHLHLTGMQKREMEKIVAESQARRNHILRKHGIDPNAKPKMWLLMGASSELKANLAHERAAAKKILTPTQLRRYDSVIKQTRRRIMSAF
jgi:hypothetical protein